MTNQPGSDIIRKRLSAEQQRIGEGRTSAVTEFLRELLIEIVLEESRLLVKPIVDRELDAENRTRGLRP